MFKKYAVLCFLLFAVTACVSDPKNEVVDRGTYFYCPELSLDRLQYATVKQSLDLCLVRWSAGKDVSSPISPDTVPMREAGLLDLVHMLRGKISVADWIGNQLSFKNKPSKLSNAAQRIREHAVFLVLGSKPPVDESPTDPKIVLIPNVAMLISQIKQGGSIEATLFTPSELLFFIQSLSVLVDNEGYLKQEFGVTPSIALSLLPQNSSKTKSLSVVREILKVSIRTAGKSNCGDESIQAYNNVITGSDRALDSIQVNICKGYLDRAKLDYKTLALAGNTYASNPNNPIYDSIRKYHLASLSFVLAHELRHSWGYMHSNCYSQGDCDANFIPGSEFHRRLGADNLICLYFGSILSGDKKSGLDAEKKVNLSTLLGCQLASNQLTKDYPGGYSYSIYLPFYFWINLKLALFQNPNPLLKTLEAAISIDQFESEFLFRLGQIAKFNTRFNNNSQQVINFYSRIRCISSCLHPDSNISCPRTIFKPDFFAENQNEVQNKTYTCPVHLLLKDFLVGETPALNTLGALGKITLTGAYPSRYDPELASDSSIHWVSDFQVTQNETCAEHKTR